MTGFGTMAKEAAFDPKRHFTTGLLLGTSAEAHLCFVCGSVEIAPGPISSSAHGKDGFRIWGLEAAQGKPPLNFNSFSNCAAQQFDNRSSTMIQ